MRCAKCGADNREGRKFCAKCAAPLARVCPQCGASNEPGENFCGECAAPLGQPPTASPKKSNDAPIRVAETPGIENLEGERKTVTPLFADIKGSTELEQDLDPEEARAIIDPALKLMIDAVRRYDGYIVQSTGDGIFALFGAPVAHEDHPQRALYAALRMQEELRRYGAKLQAEGRAPIEIRVGVNTGEVVVRSITTGASQVEYTPIGHTTNLASRLQSIARTGSIVVSEATRKFVEGYFALKPLGPTKVKGVTEPVNVYEVTGLGPLRTRLQRSAGRGLSKFVGREREMDALKRAAEQAKAGRGQLVAAMAEAGTGKSRLYFEFKASAQSGWMVLETFSVSHGKATAFLPVIDLLWNYFRIGADDDVRTRREKVAGKIAILDRTLEDTLPFLFGLLGLNDDDDPLARIDDQTRQRRMLEAIKRLILRESLNQPLMVIVEDLHWVDAESEALLNLLADSIGTAKMLLLVNYRPEYSHHWSNKSYYTQLRLDPLGMESAEEMLSALLGAGADLAPLKRVIIDRTEGNPFFMEETVQVLLDEGALVRDGTALRLTRPLAELKIPPTVQAILAARIDRLPAAEKELLHTLAIIGKEFRLGLVREVLRPNAAGAADDDLNRMLGELQLAEFIYEQPSAGDVEYTFKHALTHEVAYNSVLTERRKGVHERIAQAIERTCAAQLDDHLAELAHHYRRSGNAAKAIDYIVLAAEQASARGAHAEARAGLTAGLELLSALPAGAERARREAAIQLGLALTFGGPAVQGVEGALLRARELSIEMGDRALLFRGTVEIEAVLPFSSGTQAGARSRNRIARRSGADRQRGLPDCRTRGRWTDSLRTR
ncbi:MAG TPA: adenylate/guanylate cyclase domain-containing protein [Candidatus Binataceae bacterium]